MPPLDHAVTVRQTIDALVAQLQVSHQKDTTQDYRPRQPSQGQGQGQGQGRAGAGRGRGGISPPRGVAGPPLKAPDVVRTADVRWDIMVMNGGYMQ